MAHKQRPGMTEAQIKQRARLRSALEVASEEVDFFPNQEMARLGIPGNERQRAKIDLLSSHLILDPESGKNVYDVNTGKLIVHLSKDVLRKVGMILVENKWATLHLFGSTPAEVVTGVFEKAGIHCPLAFHLFHFHYSRLLQEECEGLDTIPQD